MRIRLRDVYITEFVVYGVVEVQLGPCPAAQH